MHPVIKTVLGQRTRSFAAALALLALTACQEPPPRQFADFMEDPIAREGTLARCNRDRELTEDDIECANARRAAAAIALIVERERREAFEVESERRIAALRAEVERERAAAREAQALAEAAARAAYDAQWRDSDKPQPVGPDGLPLPPPGETGLLSPGEFGSETSTANAVQESAAAEAPAADSTSATAETDPAAPL